MNEPTKRIPVIPDDVQHLQSIYDTDGHYMGDYVERLTDGPDLSKLKSGKPMRPMWTLGKLRPSRALDEFQAAIWNGTDCWGLRTVFHRTFGVVEQACVRSVVDDSCVWINL